MRERWNRSFLYFCNVNGKRDFPINFNFIRGISTKATAVPTFCLTHFFKRKNHIRGKFDLVRDSISSLYNWITLVHTSGEFSLDAIQCFLLLSTASPRWLLTKIFALMNTLWVRKYSYIKHPVKGARWVVWEFWEHPSERSRSRFNLIVRYMEKLDDLSDTTIIWSNFHNHRSQYIEEKEARYCKFISIKQLSGFIYDALSILRNLKAHEICWGSLNFVNIET